MFLIKGLLRKDPVSFSWDEMTVEKQYSRAMQQDDT